MAKIIDMYLGSVREMCVCTKERLNSTDLPRTFLKAQSLYIISIYLRASINPARPISLDPLIQLRVGQSALVACRIKLRFTGIIGAVT